MTRSFACHSHCQNPHNGKDELACETPNKGCDRCTPVPTTTRAFTSAVALVIVPLVVSGYANSSLVVYLENNLKRIVKTIFEARLLPLPAPAPVLAPVVATAPHYEGPRELPLKARFSDIYWGKTHLECYNFFL